MTKALHKAKFKFPHYQKIHISKKRDFSNTDKFKDVIAEKWLIPDSWDQIYPSHACLEALHPRATNRAALTPCQTIFSNKSHIQSEEKQIKTYSSFCMAPPRQLAESG